MQSDNKILDDLAKLASNAAGTIHGMANEAEDAFRAQMERYLAGFDLVKREEFEVAKEMAARARDEAEELRARVEALEAQLAANTKPKRAPRKKPAARKAAPKP